MISGDVGPDYTVSASTNLIDWISTLWVAIGSDDFSKVWIEDQLVWASGKNLKAWRLNEGLRKVHFKQGINRVLYRVENGNDKTEFSLVVSLLP